MKQRIALALGGNAPQKNGEATAEAQKKTAIDVGNILIHEEQANTIHPSIL